MAKVKNVIAAHDAHMSKKISGTVDILGAFDNMIQPFFPHPMIKLSIVITFDEITQPTVFEIRLNGPDSDLITKGEITPMVDPLGAGKKIIDVDRFLIKKRGKYTLDVFEKDGDDLKFLKTETVFIAEFPPPRRMTPSQIDEIINNEALIKEVKTEFKPIGFKNPVKIQHGLIKNSPIENGYLTIPDNNIIEIEGKTLDLTGVRRHLEWMFGTPTPKKHENEATEEKISIKNDTNEFKETEKNVMLDDDFDPYKNTI